MIHRIYISDSRSLLLIGGEFFDVLLCLALFKPIEVVSRKGHLMIHEYHRILTINIRIMEEKQKRPRNQWRGNYQAEELK
jgi:hypothetical protein